MTTAANQSPIIAYGKPTQTATLVKRYKRFLADVRICEQSDDCLGDCDADNHCDNEQHFFTVHCANSGSMKTCAEPDSRVIISDSQNPKRKLRHTWEAIEIGGHWVGVHSAWSNRLVKETIEGGAICELSDFNSIRTEVKYGDQKSRIDLLLEMDSGQCYVEVKHSTMRVGDHAAFPDAVTTRGKKHLEELMLMRSQGHRAVIFFAIGRSDCTAFRPADEIDSEYGKTLRQAVEAGVEALAYTFIFDENGAQLGSRLAIEL